MKISISAVISIFSLLLILFSCSTTNEEPAPSGPCTTCGNCSDGIKNNGETGIDCGGQCSPCSDICNGIGQSMLFPLSLNNVWKYDSNGDNIAEFELRVTNVTSMGSDKVIEFTRDDYSAPYSYSVRQLSNGDLYTHPGGMLLLPDNPTLNQTWLEYAPYYWKVVSLSSTVVTASCTYSNCIRIDEYDGTDTHTGFSQYYKRGIGIVQYSNPGSDQLIEVTLN